MPEPINTLDPDETDDRLGHFIGTVELGFWSSPLQQAPDDRKPTWEGADKFKLYWHVSVDDILQEDYEGTIPETMTISIGIGNGWWADENGQHVRHNDDASDEEIEAGQAKPRKFRVDSLLGGFLKMLATGEGYDNVKREAIVVDGGGELEYDLTGAREYLEKNNLTDVRDATVWNGTRWEFRGIKLDYKGSDFEPRMQSLPVKFLGTEDTDSGGSAKSAATTSNNPAVSAVTWTKFDASETTARDLAKLAANATSHTAFSRNALLLPEVKENAELSAGVMDESNWSD